MNYEQKYKAALEWMQGMYGGLHGKTKEEAFAVGATSILDELKTVMSVSEDKYLRENINKMISYLEGKE